MNYQYARGRNERRVSGWVIVMLTVMALGGCSLVVAGLVDYSIGKLEQMAVEAVKDYVSPPPGVGTYTPGPTLYEQLHKDWRQKVISKIDHDTWDHRVEVIKMSTLFGLQVAMDDIPKLAKWNI